MSIDLSLVEIIEDLNQPVSAGETLDFDVQFSIAGESGHNVSVVVLTPPTSNGGFTVFSRSQFGQFTGRSYNADKFNEAVGLVQAGLPGTLEGRNTVRIKGVLANSDQPGLLRFAITAEFWPSVTILSDFETTNIPPVVFSDFSSFGLAQLVKIETSHQLYGYHGWGGEHTVEINPDSIALSGVFNLPGTLDHFAFDGEVIPDAGPFPVIIEISFSGTVGQGLMVGHANGPLPDLTQTGDWADLSLGVNGGTYIFTAPTTKLFRITANSNPNVRDEGMIIVGALVDLL